MSEPIITEHRASMAFHESIFGDNDDPLHPILIGSYFFCLLVTWLYSISRWKNLIAAAVSTRFFTDQPSKQKAGKIYPGSEPHVTIQISTFNEGDVVEKTIDSACNVDWPKDKLTVQVCDDSTDKRSMHAITSRVEYWRSRGIDAYHMRRPTRVGYKAGCLHHHFDSIPSEFVLHLDADHRLEKDFCRKAMPFFFDKQGKENMKIGCVQAPWGYYNIHQNVLTEVDSLVLDIQHVIEQTGRGAAHKVFSFNGTGGIWRKDAVKAGGGWSWSTITEDLALSYESAIAGYEFVYVRDLPLELEVPAGFQAHLQQKHRWTKGFLQVFRESYFGIFCSPSIGIGLKFEAFCHVTAQLQYPIMLFVFVFFPYLVIHGLLDHPFIIFLSFFPTAELIISAIVTCFAKVPSSNGTYKNWWSRLLRTGLVPLYFGLKCGTAVFETKAALEGLFSRDATFIATPKEGSVKQATNNKKPTGSANGIKAKHWDDIAALLGILLGVHRFLFMVISESNYGYMDTTLRLINAFVCTALFVVNIGFLSEKYKSQFFTKKVGCGLPIFLMILCAHSITLSYSLLERQSKIDELALMEFNGPALKMKRGVYFTASDQLYDSTVAFLNSFRHFNPSTPLLFMPHGKINTDKTQSLADKYDFEVYSNKTLFEEIDQVCNSKRGDFSVECQKLAMWSGPLDEFLYLDADTLVLDSVDFAWPLLKHVDVAVGLSEHKSEVGNIRRRSNQVENPFEAENLSLENKFFDDRTGVILSSKKFGSMDGLLTKIKDAAKAVDEGSSPKTSYHTLLNYLFVSSGKRLGSLSSMSKDVTDVKVEVRASGDSDLKVTSDHRVQFKKEEEDTPIFLVHGTSKKEFSKQQRLQKLWQFWRDL